MKKQVDIMVAGHVCLDITPRFPDSGARSINEIMTPGKLVNIGACELSTGGVVSNTGIAMKKLGHAVCLSARVGDDQFGRLTSGLLKQAGDADAIKSVKNQTSSYTIALAPPEIDRIFLHHPGTNDLFSSDDLDPVLLAQCRHFHFGYPPLMKNMFRHEGRDLKRVFQIARDAGTITSCDMSLPDPLSDSGQAPWPQILKNILPYIDIFLPSVEEAFFMLEPDTYLKLKEKDPGVSLIDHLKPGQIQSLANRLLAMGPGMVALKCGHLGLYFKSTTVSALQEFCLKSGQKAEKWASRELWCPAFKIDRIASAAGAGDAAIAGFLSALMHNLPPEKCLKYACALGWENLHGYDTVSGIKSFEETSKLLEDHLQSDFFEINDPGWVWHKENQLWVGSNDSLHTKINKQMEFK